MPADDIKQLPFEYPTRWPELLTLFRTAIEKNDSSAWLQLERSLEERDRALEDQLYNEPIIFDHDSGAPLRSKVWTPKWRTRIKDWYLEFAQDDDGEDLPQGADFTLELHFDGVMVRQLTMPAGDVFVEYSGEALPDIPPRTRVTMWSEEIADFDFVSTLGL